MTETEPQTALDSTRLNERDLPWPLRPWLMAALCMAAGLAFHLLLDTDGSSGRYGDDILPQWRIGLATFVGVAAISFTLSLERYRWQWAAVFAVIWGAVLGFIGWKSTGFAQNYAPVQWPFLSGMLAVLIATPLFQAWRDVAGGARDWKLWQLPYDRLHTHAWADAVLGAAAMLFVGITFLLMALIGEMFELIDISFVKDLMDKGWFGWMLAGAAFGGAIGLLRERDRLVAILQRLVTIVLAVLSPLLALALTLFLLSLLGTGLAPLWESGFSTAGLMLAAAAFAVLLANAVFGNGGEDRSGNRVLLASAAALAVAVLPMAIIAGVAMGLRVGEYGWTPQRLWGAVAVAIALGYGIAGLVAVVRGRAGFDAVLRPLQQKLAIGLMLLALVLALPIIDFGGISARDQVARLQDRRTKLTQFDWRAMAFQFGPQGRRELEKLTKSLDRPRSDAAKLALSVNDPYDLPDAREMDEEALLPIDQRLRVLPAGRALPTELIARLQSDYRCRTRRCIVLWVDDAHVAVLPADSNRELEADQARLSGQLAHFYMGDDKKWSEYAGAREEPVRPPVESATVETRTVSRTQVFVDDKPYGEAFE